jgi:hypothetical protein
MAKIGIKIKKIDWDAIENKLALPFSAIDVLCVPSI